MRKSEKNRNRVLLGASVITVVGAFTASHTYASLAATDNASDAVYSGGGNYNGLNGGTGFQAWSVSPTSDGSNNGAFIGDSTSNGGSGSGSPGESGGINSTGNKAFGTYANSGSFTDAYRQFTADGGGQALGNHQTFSIEIDNGYIDNGQTVGIGLQTTGGANRWEFYFTGGNSDYMINDGSGPVASSLGYTDGGLLINFTVTGANSYTATISGLNGDTQSETIASGTLIGTPSSFDIGQIHVFDANAGSGGSHNFFVNDLSIVPEPASVSLVGGSVIMLSMLRRRRDPKAAE